MLAISDFIDRVYALALDPTNFDEFCHWLEEHLDNLSTLEQDIEPHLKQAAELLNRLDAADTQNNQALTGASYVAFQVNADGIAHGLNHAAEKMLHVDRFFAQEQIDQLLKDAAQLARSPEKKFQTTAILNVETDASILFQVSNFSRFTLHPNNALVVSTSVYWSAALAMTLKEQFGLTKAELDIVHSLMDGQSAKKIAELRNRSFETVRTQIRKILRKTHIESQLDLVRLILGLVVTPMDQEGAASVVQRSTQRFITAKGAVLHYVDIGSDKSPTLFFLRDYESYPELPDELFTLLLRKGFRVITVDYVDAESEIDCWEVVAPISELAQHLGLKHFAYLAGETALPLAQALANLEPSCRGILALSSTPSDALKEVNDPLLRQRNLLSMTVEKMPLAMPLLLRARMAGIQKIGRTKTIQRLYTSHEDQDYLSNVEALERLANVLTQVAPEHAVINEFDRSIGLSKIKTSQSQAPVMLLQSDQSRLSHYANPQVVASSILNSYSTLEKSILGA